MDKLTMAHDYAVKNLDDSVVDVKEYAAWCWSLADAMQAEAEKREKEKQDKAKQEQQNYEDALNSIGVEQWQPDWSQAPVWVNVWAMDENGIAHWYCGKYDLDQEFDCWMYDSCGLGDGTCKVAPHFNYTGNWQDSLRKRPHGE